MSVKAGLISRAPNNLGLVGYWPMDEGAGSMVGDFSGNRNTGNITGNPVWTSAKRGMGLKFNSTNNITLSSPLSSMSTYTASAWVRINGTTPDAYHCILSQDYNNNILCYGDSEKKFLSYGNFSTYYTDHTYPIGQWYHLVVARTPTNQYIYVNGVLDGSFSNSNAAALTYIGSGENTVETLNGDLDDVRIYNRALTAAEISKLYSSGTAIRKGVSNSGLVGYWPMDEGRGNQVGDSSGKGNTGNITDATWTNGERGKALRLTQSGNCSSYADMGDPASGLYDFGTGDFTVAFWVKKRVQSSSWSNTWGISKWNSGETPGSNEWEIGLSGTAGNDNTPTFMIESGNTSYSKNGTQSMNLNTWYHLVGVRNGTAMKLYVNAVAQGSDTVLPGGTAINNVGRKLMVGYSPLGVYCPNADFDDIRLYNRALSATEIQSLYKQNSTTVGTSYENRLTNGLVGFWTMNGKDYNSASTTAEVLDKSGQGNNGDNVGAVTTIGKLGQGLKFNHASGYVTVPNTASLRPSNVTVSAWVYLNSTQAAYLVLKDKSLGSSYQLTNSISGTADYFSFCSYVSGSYTCAEAPNIVRDWVHLVGIYDGTNRYLYVNGILKSTVPGGAIDYTNPLPLYIGGYTAANYGLDGNIDEVRIYNRALSADEVKQLYKMGQ